MKDDIADDLEGHFKWRLSAVDIVALIEYVCTS